MYGIVGAQKIKGMPLKNRKHKITHILYCATLGYTYPVKILTYFKMYEIIIIERKKGIG